MKKVFLSFVLGMVALPMLAQAPALEPKQDAKKPQWGYVNPSTGKWVVKPSYSVVEPFTKGADGKYRALVTKGNLQGFLGTDGKPLGAGIVFESIEPLMEGTDMLVSVKGKKGVINLDGVYQLKPEFTDVRPFGSECYIVEIKGKRGVISADGNMLIEPEYNSVYANVPGYFIVDKGGKAGIFSREGKMLLAPGEYTEVRRLGKVWQVLKKDKMGLYDTDAARLLVKPDYVDVGEPVKMAGEVFYPVKKSVSWGLLDDFGKRRVKIDYKAIEPAPVFDAFLVTSYGGYRLLYFPKTGKFSDLGEWNVEEKGPFKRVSGKMTGGDRQGAFDMLLDKDGKQIQCMELLPLGQNWLVIPTATSPWVLYSSEGDMIRRTSLRGELDFYSETEGWQATEDRVIFTDGREGAFMGCGEKLQFVKFDGDGQWTALIDDRPSAVLTGFDSMQATDNDNEAAVERDGKWGLITDGKLKYACEYPTPLRKSEFDGYYEIGNPGALGLVSPDGTIVIDPEFDTIAKSKISGCLEVKQGDTIGVYDLSTGMWIFPVERGYTSYKPIDDDADTMYWVYKGDLGGVATGNGKEIVPVIYDSITRYGSLDMFGCEPVGGGAKKYYTLDGIPAQPKPKGVLTDLSHEGDRKYYNQNGEMQWVDINVSFLKGHKIKVVGQLFNANGTPHITRGGDTFKREYTWTVDDDTFFIDDQSIHIPYDFISQPRHTERDYFMKYTLIDVTTGKVLDTKKIKFGMQRH